MPFEMNFDSKEEFLRALRDWFAGQALAGLLANSSTSTAYAKDIANLAYRHADAILAERSKQ